ncbi:hypothetical protein DFP72DRAFT_1163498 [Ephemerocybe angulata]|uniref:Uncharacterized protein n=1 Tax=Ephemerocybe angulata TaxID=980116 RepID=A0A8H6II39_9AGAR|nr:hypothetical protein DFP72DRAFT_1163498 [Tulosesus angulatus]
MIQTLTGRPIASFLRETSVLSRSHAPTQMLRVLDNKYQASTTYTIILRPLADVSILHLVYMAAISYSFVLVYVPQLRRPMLYAHLAITYSLLIAALVSMLKGELSRADGLFVIVAVASPPSIALWYFTFKSLWIRASFPLYPYHKSLDFKSHSSSFEFQAARLLSFGSLIFELAMVCLLFIPDVERINFPQSVCDKQYGTSGLWYNIVWQLPLLAQLIGGVIACGIVYLCARAGYSADLLVIQARNARGDVQANEVDLVSWTHQVLLDIYPNFMTDNLFLCIITCLQLSVLPSHAHPQGHSNRQLAAGFFVAYKDVFCVIIFAYGTFKEWFSSVDGLTRMFALRSSIPLVLIGVCVTRFIYHGPMPSSIFLLQLFLTYSFVYWCHIHITLHWARKLLLTCLIALPLLTVALHQVFSLYNDIKSYPGGGSPVQKVSPDGSTWSIFTLNLFTIIGWIPMWLLSSTWLWRKHLQWDLLRSGIWRRTHILKFCLVYTVHVLWIQASNNSNPGRPTEMPFGQIFALIATFATIIPLLDEARRAGKEHWKAFLLSRPMPRRWILLRCEEARPSIAATLGSVDAKSYGTA